MNYLDDVREFVSLRKRVLSPISAQKVIAVGYVLGLNADSRVIDFGCGMGEALSLWGIHFGISGVGIDRDGGFCARARERLSELGLGSRIEIVCMDAADYAFAEQGFDAATCLGASSIWGGFRPTLQRIRQAIQPGGKLAIGEPYYIIRDVPRELVAYEGHFHTELEILQIVWEEGFEVEWATRATADDWDRYVASNWYQTVHALRENRDAADRQRRIKSLHRDQDAYPYRLQYQGFAIYVLSRLSPSPGGEAPLPGEGQG